MDLQPSAGIMGGGALPTRFISGGGALLVAISLGGGPALAPAELALAFAGSSRDLDLCRIDLIAAGPPLLLWETMSDQLLS